MKNFYWYFICFFTCFIFSCKYKENKKQITPPVAKFKTDSISFSSIDSLNYYGSKYDSIRVEIDYPKAVLYIHTVNGIRTGVIGFNDSITTVYKKSALNWQETSSIDSSNEIWGINEIDLNNDGFKDLRLLFPVMRGNIVCEVFLFDNLSQSFKHNSYYDLINIGFDAKTGLIRSCALGGLFDNSKSLYRITGDSLTFYKRVEEEIDGYNKYGSVMRFYENKNGSEKLIKTIKGSWNNIPARFDTALWKDGLAYFD